MTTSVMFNIAKKKKKLDTKFKKIIAINKGIRKKKFMIIKTTKQYTKIR